MTLFALAVAAVTLAAGLGVGALACRLPTVRARLAGFGLGAVLLPLVAVLVSGLVMFDSEHDLAILAVACGSALAALGGAALVGRSLLRPVGRLRDASAALAGGDLTARAPAGGPAELAAVSASFNDMAARLEELFDARRQLVAWASHDLRTPLASLQAMLEAVEDGLVEPAHYLPAMGEQVRALGRLTDDLFELARLEAGALSLELRAAPVSDLVASCLRGVEAEAHARRVRLEARVPRTDAAVRCAPEQVERVLCNLVRNALRHTPSDGAVAVVVRAGADEVEVAVEDTGEGLPPEAERRMFEGFWRGDRARGTDGGAGLGLAIARGLVEAQGGRIWAENRPEGGARVCFTLPAAEAAPAPAVPAY